MTLKRCLRFVGFLVFLAVTPAFAQTTRTTLPQTGSDPFTLTTGSSFSASGSGSSSLPATTSKARISTDFQEALEIIRNSHANGTRLDTGTLTSTAISSMLKALDPHSNYYDAAEYQNLLGEHQSEYSGTGSSIAGFVRNGKMEIFVVTTFPGSPAAAAKLRFGDRIVAVNGQSVSGRSPDVVRDLVRGKRGTSVRLTIERADNGAVETHELLRTRVHQPAVPDGFLLRPGVGYMDLTAGFSNATTAELETALAGLHRQGMSSLVLDIRGNGGGIVNQAVNVAEKFLPAGSTIVSQRGRYPDDSHTWKARKTHFESIPLVLLVDENTASASEVLAGALQDNDRALIIGQKTFGKGLVQNVLSLPSGSGLALTAARYYTPSGRSIQRDYADVGLYDYFNHRNATAEIERSVFVARTLTNRVVYGGDGIAPDEISKPSELDATKLALLDPLFFFARDAANGRIGGIKNDGGSAIQQLRQQIMFGEPTVTDAIVDQFTQYADKEYSGKFTPSSLERERDFIKDTLRYNLAMAAFGMNSANRAKIESDPQVRQAINALPKAANLAAAAGKARSTAKKEKGSLSLVLNEQR